MRRFFLIILTAAALCALAWGIFVEPYRIEVTHTYVEGQVARPLKIAHLTDLHTGGLGRREKRLLELLDEEQPDVIIITGDTLTTGFSLRPDQTASLTFARAAGSLAGAGKLGKCTSRSEANAHSIRNFTLVFC